MALGMAMHRAAHSVYDCWYHLVWTPKRRRPVLLGKVGTRLEEAFAEIAEAYDIEIATLHVGEDHVHLLVGFPPRLSISRVVNILKSLSAIQLFREFPWLSARMVGGKLWEEGYFVRTVGEGVDASIVTRYIERHASESDLADF